jgi:hypothetical protein
MVTKGVLGIGCSFMWGEGLYYYSNLKNTPPLKETHQFDGTDVLTEAHIAFKNKNRFLRIVTDEYGMWDISNVGNGGSNVRNIKDYINEFLIKPVGVGITDFDLIIYQFTSHDRDFINQRRTEDGWLTGEPMPIEDQIEFVNTTITDWESHGVKVVTLSWYEEFPNHPLYQKYFKNRHVDIEIDGDVQNSFEYFLHKDKYNVTISSDFKEKGFQKNDIHFNLKGHRCVANSIIKKLKNDNWSPTNII